MRKIRIEYIRPGMILGRNLYDKQYSLLLSRGQILTEQSIKRIKNLKYQAIYIYDQYDLYEQDDQYNDTDFFIEDISEVLRNNAVLTVKELFSVENAKAFSKNMVANVEHTVNDIVNEIVLNKSATYTMTDLKLFDDYTYFHSVNVTVIAIILGFAIGLNKTSLCKLGMGALLHDIGKIFVPLAILQKQGKLTSEEYGLVQKHSRNGYDYLRKMKDFPEESRQAVLTHHEKYSGGGYPDGIHDKEIPLFGRIMAIADVFDALVSDRPYRKALEPSEAVEHIIGGSGEHFDPDLVDIFLEKISPYPVGTNVILSNGLRALVVENHPKFGLRPIVKIIGEFPTPKYYDLSQELLEITIKGVCCD